MIILGLHGGWTLGQHDASACVVKDGVPVALCEEERYTRIKGSYGQMPQACLLDALRLADCLWEEVDAIVIPGATYADGEAKWMTYLTRLMGSAPKALRRVHHQLAHAASAYYGSGYPDALVVSLDNRGDGTSGGILHGEEGRLSWLTICSVEESIGAFYTRMTEYCGFADGDEYKLMGLAPYGTARYDRRALEVQTMPRSPQMPLTDYYRDIAASTQQVCEEAILALLQPWHGVSPRLCYAGGVALNCKANARLCSFFEHISVSPVAGDRGLSLGAAYLEAMACGDRPQPLSTPYLGAAYNEAACRAECEANGIVYSETDTPELLAAGLLLGGRVIGWYQGRSEAGARALGNRSILALATLPAMREHVNTKIKHREEFRPFAPAVLWEQAQDYFEIETPSPWMTRTVQARKPFPAVTHLDGSARIQTVQEADNPLFHRLLLELKNLSGTGMMLNTSFNLRGQPIVETPRDALMTFYGSGLDTLFLGRLVIHKAKGRH